MKRERRDEVKGSASDVPDRKKRKPSDSEEGNEDEREDGEDYMSRYLVRNELFDKYYRMQGIVRENEWELFDSAVHKPLPVTFRVNADSVLASRIIETIEKDFIDEIKKSDAEDAEIPCPLAWYHPPKHGWKVPVGKRTLRRCEAFQRFRQFLIRHNDLGTISRQEEVSMVSTFFLDLKRHHRILDMCAAPGSKTAQILEAIGVDSTGKSRSDSKDGFVVANDINTKRAYLLSHQTQRYSSLFPNLIITSHDAKCMPTLYLGEEAIRFDRILCDVVCSGDGTVRKAPDLWRRWTPRLGHELHRTQVNIGKRCVQLLAKNGLMVYSTCSLNPIEDEAVVAELLRLFPDELELVDVSHLHPSLKRAHGLSKWVVTDPKGNVIEDFPKKDASKDRAEGKGDGEEEGLEEEDEEEATEGVGCRRRRARKAKKEPKLRLHASMFPPTEEVADTMHLDRCMRFLPHLQDTGGFFVAVLRRTKGDPPRRRRPQTTIVPTEEKTTIDALEDPVAESEKKEKTIVEATTADPNVKTKQKKKKRQNEPDELYFHGLKEELSSGVRDWYHLDAGFLASLLARSGKRDTDVEAPKRLVHVSPAVHGVLLENREQEAWRIVNAGLVVFERGSDSNYRLTQNAILTTIPHMSERIIPMTWKDFSILLREDSPFFSSFSPEVQAILAEYHLWGPFAALWQDPPEGVDPMEVGAVVSCTRARVSISVNIGKQAREALYDVLQLCLGDECPPLFPTE